MEATGCREKFFVLSLHLLDQESERGMWVTEYGWMVWF